MKTPTLLLCLTLLLACAKEQHCVTNFEPSAPEGFTLRQLQVFEYDGDLEKMQFVNKNTGFILANRSGIDLEVELFKTTNGGTSWDTLTVPNSRSPIDILFLDENNGFVTHWTDFSYPVMKKTEDGGQSWAELTYPDLEGRISHLYADADQNLYGKLSLLGIPTQILKSTDKGETWQTILTLPNLSGDILELHQDRLYLELPDKEVMVTDLDGNHIKNIRLDQLRHSMVDFAVIDADNIIVTSGYAAIKTTDGGVTWEAFFNIPVRVIGFASPNDGIMVIDKGYCGDSPIPYAVIAHTTDGGDSWKESEYTDELVDRVVAVETVSGDQHLILVNNWWDGFALVVLER